jgi:large subunit ribosomal protein L4e
VPFWSYVRSNQSLAQVAPEAQLGTKVWCSIHSRKAFTYNHLRRFATASAIAASSSAALLMARGHNVSSVPEVPLVISSTAFRLTKTSGATTLLRAVGAGADIEKARKSRKLRAGKGKMRGRRFRQRRGPLLVFNPEEDGIELGRAFKNVPGVESCSVHALNLLQLAPGGHLGRFIVWTSAAFAALDEIYGSTTEPSALKKDFLLPSVSVKQPDLNKLINSSEIQAVLRPVKGSGITKRSVTQKKNPLRNRQVLLRLNPYAAQYSKQKLGQAKGDSDEPKELNEEFVDTLREP